MEVSPIVSRAARSVAEMSTGVTLSSGMFVNPALKSAESFWICPCSTENGRCTSLFLTVLSPRRTTIMKVFASM